MPQKKQPQHILLRSIPKKTMKKKKGDMVDTIADSMILHLNKIKESDGLKKAKNMLFTVVRGVNKAVKQFVEEHPLTLEQQRMLYKEMKMIAEGTGSHGFDVDFHENLFMDL